MKSSHIAIAVFALVVPFAIWYEATADQCPVPLSYRLGELDDSFSLTREEAQIQITLATDVWEELAVRDLFVYDPAADFTVNFLFDTRQETVNSEEAGRVALDKQKQKNDEVVGQIQQLQTEYDALAENYEARVVTYEVRLDAHNQEVSTYNDRGGAPAVVFERLENEKRSLATEADSLNSTAQALNQLAQEINQLSERGSKIVDQYNRDVNEYNAEFGYAREFTQGDYQGDKINIYSFSTENELQKVLAHEFGHALGIDHIDDNSALMYYLMDEPDSALILSAADETAYIAVCGTTETFGQRVRHAVRSFLALF